jgi:hypothetical protein
MGVTVTNLIATLGVGENVREKDIGKEVYDEGGSSTNLV